MIFQKQKSQDVKPGQLDRLLGRWLPQLQHVQSARGGIPMWLQSGKSSAPVATSTSQVPRAGQGQVDGSFHFIPFSQRSVGIGKNAAALLHERCSWTCMTCGMQAGLDPMFR